MTVYRLVIGVKHMSTKQWLKRMITASSAVTASLVMTVGQTADDLATATFAGGCFWCMEEAFEKVEGVDTVISGYTDGRVADPTYQQVSAGRTGHTEAIQIAYDPSQVSYQELLRSSGGTSTPRPRIDNSATEVVSIEPPSSITMRSSSGWRRHRDGPLRGRSPSRNRS